MNENETLTSEQQRRDNFYTVVKERYEDDWAAKLTGAAPWITDAVAREYFHTMATALYENRIEGWQGYGKFLEADDRTLTNTEGTPKTGRQELVDIFHEEVRDVIRSLGELAAQGQTLLWSNPGIGRFAVDDEAIVEAAGVVGDAEPLDATRFGTLCDKLLLTTDANAPSELQWDRSYQIWAAISKELAMNAEGDVHVFLPRSVGALSVFWNVELQELRKRMAPYTTDPKVSQVIVHRPTDAVADQVIALANEEYRLSNLHKKTPTPEWSARLAELTAEKEAIMRDSANWTAENILDASIDVSQLSETQKRRLRESVNPRARLLLERLTEKDPAKASLSLSKLKELTARWRRKALRIDGLTIERMKADERQRLLVSYLVDKYPGDHSVTTDLLKKMADYTASPEEQRLYADGSRKLVSRFAAEMRANAPDSYTDLDIKIITAMLATKHKRFVSQADASLTKVLPKSGVQNALEKNLTTQANLSGFAALSDHVQDLSPEQVIDRFGLDYVYHDSADNPVHPYLKEDASGYRGPDDAVFYVTTAVMPSVRQNARIPIDPRVLGRILDLAEERVTDTDTDTRRSTVLADMAREVAKPEVCTVMVHTGLSQEERNNVIDQYQTQRQFQLVYGAPPTDPNTATAEYGDKIESGLYNAGDVLHEVFVPHNTPGSLSPGSAIYARGTPAQLRSPDSLVPQGAEDIRLAEWDGKRWHVSVTKNQTLPDWLRLRVTREELNTWRATGETRTSLPDALPKEIRAVLESHFHQDLRHVVIQQGDTPSTPASNTIYFPAGAFDPNSDAGIVAIADKLQSASLVTRTPPSGSGALTVNNRLSNTVASNLLTAHRLTKQRNAQAAGVPAPEGDKPKPTYARPSLNSGRRVGGGRRS